MPTPCEVPVARRLRERPSPAASCTRARRADSPTPVVRARGAGLELALPVLVAWGAAPARPEEKPGEALRAEVERALARIDAQATEWKPELAGDARMTEALRAALAWPEEAGDARVRGRGAMIALALFVDDSGMYAANPLGGAPYAAVWPAEARGRGKTLGRSLSILERHDWAQHWAVTGALATQLGSAIALQAGYAKEISDAKERETGPASGFSFADLEADYAGVEFARRLLGGGGGAGGADVRRRALAGAPIVDFTPDLREMPEELTYTEFVRDHGGLRDARYRTMVEKIRRRIAACTGFAEAGAETEKR